MVPGASASPTACYGFATEPKVSAHAGDARLAQIPGAAMPPLADAHPAEGTAPPCLAIGNGYRRPAPARPFMCWPAARRALAARPAPRTSLSPSVPSFSSSTVFATVTRLRQSARVRSARCSPGPCAALRAAASAPALAACLHLVPLVARCWMKNWAESERRQRTLSKQT